MGSSEVDESSKVLQGSYGSSVRWTIALLTLLVVGNLMFSGFLLWKLTVQERRLDTTVEKVKVDVEELQVARDEMKQFYETLFEYTGEREKRSAASPSQSSGGTVNVGHVFVSLIKEMCKPEGAICVPGQAGRDGLPGLPGRDGKDGQPGRNGRIGLPGPAGKDGKAGRNGEAGSKGSAGKQGPRGIAGMKGDMGRSGEKGEKGDRGERGVGGLQGILGPRGEKGKEGEKGERGEIGYKGEKGGKGEIGLRGEKGIKGDAGMKGNKGNEQDLLQLLNVPSQCLPWNHRVLHETWRQTSEHYSKTSYHCDHLGSSSNQHGFTPGWYSFSPIIGGSMPESCTSENYCGTRASGWLNGSHPNVIGQNVSRTVCFNWNGDCCYYGISVEVINCGQYYVYNLPDTPDCYLAYCARGQPSSIS